MEQKNNRSRLIMCYGLTKEEANVVYNNLPARNFNVITVDNFTDIIASVQMVAIIRWECMTESDRTAFEIYFTDIQPFLETVIVIGNSNVNSNLKKYIHEYDSFDIMVENLSYKILDAYKKTKKSVNFSTKLANALVILKKISKKPYISTQELADILELSPRSVQRYIETLRVAGEWIEYDTQKKGWIMGPECDVYDDSVLEKSKKI